MDRRTFLASSFGLGCSLALFGCRGRQVAHVLDTNEADMVGSHTAGAATWKPLVHQSVCQLLGRHSSEIVPVSAQGIPAAPRAGARICFVGVENASSEEIGDFKEQIYEQIDTSISQAGTYSAVSRRFVEAGLRQTRLHPEDLFLPANRTAFAAALEQMDAPFDFLLFAKVTSGTTISNARDYQRDYMLTLEMVDVRTGAFDKESATLRKGYHKSRFGKVKHYGVG